MSRVWKVGLIRRQLEMSKRVKPYGFTTESVKLAFSVRYGTKVLELAKGIHHQLSYQTTVGDPAKPTVRSAL